MNDISTNIKERILELADYKAIPKSKFVKIIGSSYGNFTGKSKSTDISGRILADISVRYPDINMDWLLTGVGEISKENVLTGKGEMLRGDGGKNGVSLKSLEGRRLIPLIPQDAMAGFGQGSTQITVADLSEGYLIPEFEARGVEYLIRINGSSMYPKYASGDLIGCRKISGLRFVQPGKVYVLDTEQGILIKRIFEVPDADEFLECRSDNERYPPFKIRKEDIYHVAIVLGVVRLE